MSTVNKILKSVMLRIVDRLREEKEEEEEENPFH
jgi:hypothetical protein